MTWVPPLVHEKFSLQDFAHLSRLSCNYASRSSLVYYYMTSEFGNASSTEHEYGDRAEAAVNQAAKHLANLVGASPREMIWTSGATESINLAIQGSLSPHPEKPCRTHYCHWSIKPS